jgi:hypothetical protein
MKVNSRVSEAAERAGTNATTSEDPAARAGRGIYKQKGEHVN